MSELRTVTDRGRLRQVSNRNLHNSDTPGNIVYALKPSRRSFFKEADYCIMIKKKKILTFLSETLHLITKHFDKKHLGIPAAPLRWQYKYNPCLCNLRVNWQEIHFCKWALGQFWSYVKCKIRALCMEKKKKRVLNIQDIDPREIQPTCKTKTITSYGDKTKHLIAACSFDNWPWSSSSKHNGPSHRCFPISSAPLKPRVWE